MKTSAFFLVVSAVAITAAIHARPQATTNPDAAVGFFASTLVGGTAVLLSVGAAGESMARRTRYRSRSRPLLKSFS